MPNVVASDTIEQNSNNDTMNVCQRLLAAEDRSLYFGREAVSAKGLPVLILHKFDLTGQMLTRASKGRRVKFNESNARVAGS